MTAFVDFSPVWLACNDDLLAQGPFAAEDINLKIGEGEFITGSAPAAACRWAWPLPAWWWWAPGRC